MITFHWLSNIVNKLLNLSINSKNYPKIIPQLGKVTNRLKMNVLLEKHQNSKISSEVRPKWGKKHEAGLSKSSAFGNTCSSYKKLSRSAKLGNRMALSIKFAEKKSKTNEFETIACQYSFFNGYSNYIKNCTSEIMKYVAEKSNLWGMPEVIGIDFPQGFARK